MSDFSLLLKNVKLGLLGNDKNSTIMNRKILHVAHTVLEHAIKLKESKVAKMKVIRDESKMSQDQPEPTCSELSSYFKYDGCL